jgi:hypothetical protein
MNLDFQIALTAFEPVVAQTVNQLLVTQRFAVPPGVIQLPFGSLFATPSPCVIDHISIDSAQVLQTGAAPYQDVPPVSVSLNAFNGASLPLASPVQPIIVAVDATVFIAQQSQLDAANQAPVANNALFKLKLRISYLISIAVAGGQATLSFAFHDLEINTPLGYLDVQQLIQLIQERIADHTLSAQTAMQLQMQLMSIESSLNNEIPPSVLNLSGITNLLGDQFQLWNAGIAIKGGLLTIRAQIDTTFPNSSTWVAEWTDFYQSGPHGRLVDSLSSADWALFVEDAILLRAVEKMVRDIFSQMPNTSILDEDPVVATWTLDTGNALILVHFGVDAGHSCPPWGVNIRANVDLRVKITQDTISPSALRIDLHVDIQKYAGDVFYCAVSDFFLGWLDFFAQGLDRALLALLGPIGVFGAVIWFGEQYPLHPGQPVGGFQPLTPDSNTDFFMDLTIPLPSLGGFGSLTMTGIDAVSDGLALGGTLVATPATPAMLVAGPPSGFQWLAAPTCPPDGVSAVAQFLGTNSGETLLYFSHAEILSPIVLPPIGVRGAFRSGRDTFTVPNGYIPISEGWKVTETVPQETVVALQNLLPVGTMPAPFKVLLQSNGGARILTIPGIDASLTADAAGLAVSGRAAACNELQILSGSVRVPVSPGDPWQEVIGDVEWSFAVASVQPGAVLVVRDEHGSLVAAFAARGDGLITSARAWIPQDLRSPLVLSIEDAAPGGVGTSATYLPVQAGSKRVSLPIVKEAPRLIVARALYSRASSVEIPGKEGTKALGKLGGKTCLALAGDLGVKVFNLSNPFRPRLAFWRSERGLSGATFSGGQLVTWGAGGLWRSAAGAGTKLLLEGLTRDALALRGALVALQDDGIRVLGAGGSLSSLPVDDGEQLAAIGQTVVVRTGSALQLFDLSAPAAPKSLGKVKAGPVKGMVSDGGGRDPIVLLADGTEAMLDLTNGGSLRKVVVTDAATRSLRMGPIAVLSRPDGTAVDVYRLVDSETSLRCAPPAPHVGDALRK